MCIMSICYRNVVINLPVSKLRVIKWVISKKINLGAYKKPSLTPPFGWEWTNAGYRLWYLVRVQPELKINVEDTNDIVSKMDILEYSTNKSNIFNPNKRGKKATVSYINQYSM